MGHAVPCVGHNLGTQIMCLRTCLLLGVHPFCPRWVSLLSQGDTGTDTEWWDSTRILPHSLLEGPQAFPHPEGESCGVPRGSAIILSSLRRIDFEDEPCGAHPAVSGQPQWELPLGGTMG